VELGGYGNVVENDSMELISKDTVAQVSLRFRCSLLPGTYFMNVGIVGSTEQGDTYLHRGVDVVMFEVIHEKEISPTAIIDFGITPTVSFERHI
jgi:lipopolysaccharide transport system ATP-binding protein